MTKPKISAEQIKRLIKAVEKNKVKDQNLYLRVHPGWLKIMRQILKQRKVK